MQGDLDSLVHFGGASGTSVITDGAWLLLDAHIGNELPHNAWTWMHDGRPSDWLISALGDGSLLTCPSFALVAREESGLRVFVRGKCRVEIDGVSISGEGATTWIEQTAPFASVMQMSLGDETPQGASACLSGAGIVPAEWISIRWERRDEDRRDEDRRDEDRRESEQSNPPAVVEVDTGAMQSLSVPAHSSMESSESSLVVRFSDSRTFELRDPLVVGRAPVVQSSDDKNALAVTIDAGDISRSHVMVERAANGVSVIDVGSSNGTWVTQSGGQPEMLAPHQPRLVMPGDRVYLSEEVWFEVERS